MKKTILMLAISNSIAMGVSAQEVLLKDGLYYTAGGNLFEGKYITYFDSGNKKSMFSVVDGKANDTVTYFYENGSIMEKGTFVNNVKDGKWLRWDETEHKIAEAYYASGKKNGTWQIWDSNGTKRYEMHYKLGEKMGTWLMWDEKGKLANEKHYESL